MFSGLPVQCDSYTEHTCYCHYFLTFRANVYNCSYGNEKRLPPSVPHGTNWFLLQRNHIFELNSNFKYLRSIWFLDLKSNSIKLISDTFIDTVKKGGEIKWLDLSENNLARIPSTIQELTFLEKVWLDGNPFHCDCEMTWMIGWLNNFTGPDGEHKIVNYDRLVCHQGIMKGMPIYLLKVVDMGCFPREWTLWQKVGVGIGAVVTLGIITGLVITSIRISKSLRFFIFHKLKIRSALYWNAKKEDENLENIKYDAYLTFRYGGLPCTVISVDTVEKSSFLHKNFLSISFYEIAAA